ncbi:MAG TPA: hypothetical protein VGE07_12285 [Herpetosiphonaceae bacterium]
MSRFMVHRYARCLVLAALILSGALRATGQVPSRPAPSAPPAPAPGIEGAAPYLVKDLAPAIDPDASVRTYDWTVFGDRLYFLADSFDHGSALWSSDGTLAGTALVRRLTTRFDQPARWLHVHDGALVFVTPTAGHLWRSDGTAAGTRPAAAIAMPGYAVQAPIYDGNTLSYVLQSETLSEVTKVYTLYTVDLARGAAVRVPLPAPAADPISLLGSLGGRLLVGGAAGLWAVAPDATVTALASVFIARPADVVGEPAAIIGNIAYFAASTVSQGMELWRTDGTPAGTRLVKEIIPSYFSSSPQDFVVHGNAFYFSATQPATGRELWRSDGTAAGTALVRDINPGAADGAQDLIGANSQGLILLAHQPATGDELWRSNGTAAGTALIRDSVAGAGGLILPHDAAALANQTLVFAAQDSQHGQEVWRSDGTAAGTGLLRDLTPGAERSDPVPQILFRNRVIIVDEDAPWNVRWSASDGTAAGTVELGVFNPQIPLSSDPSGFVTLGGWTYFRAELPTAETALWRTDGTPEGTTMLRSWPGRLDLDLHPVGMRLYFAIENELWRSDGTVAGTQPVQSFNSEPYNLTSGPEGLLFVRESVSGSVLWHMRGEPGAEQFEVLLSARSNVENLEVIKGRIFFTSEAIGTPNTVLFASNGTAAGTIPVLDSIAYLRSRTAVGDDLFFQATRGGRQELWRSDGTAAGTQLITADAPPLTEMVELNNILYAMNCSGSCMLWRSDGTAAGTAPVVETARDLTLAASGDWLYFNRWTPETGAELWRSDGTAAGMQPVADLVPGPASGRAGALKPIQGSLFFWAHDAAEGWELWHTAGTAESTARHVVAPGPLHGSIRFGSPVVVGRRLLWSADDGATGNELWAIDLPQGSGVALDVAPVAATAADRVAGLRVAMRAEGPAPTTNLTLTVVLTGGLRYAGSTLGAPTIAGSALSWSAPALGIYGNEPATIWIQAPEAPLGASYPVTATLSGASPDPTPQNNTGSGRVLISLPHYLPRISR